MDAALAMAAYNGLKFAKDSLTTLVQGKIEVESQAKILDALEKLGTAQDALFQMRDELFTLQAENLQLQKEIERHNSWNERLTSYALVKTAGGAVVYKFKGEPEHFACPSCANNQKLEILQDNRTMSGKFRCTGCEAEYPVKPRENLRPIHYE
jgi:NAD-dependent SIR2 family protein deacetylase